jgi:hypothetical protein
MSYASEKAPKPAREKGRFAKGSSGNPAGRPAKHKKRHSMPEINRRAAFDIAEREITLKANDTLQTVTLYQANLLRLAMDGANGNRNAARLFIAEVNRAASMEWQNSAIVEMLLSENEEQERELEALRSRVPRNGVVIDPTMISRQLATSGAEGNPNVPPQSEKTA